MAGNDDKGVKTFRKELVLQWLIPGVDHDRAFLATGWLGDECDMLSGLRLSRGKSRQQAFIQGATVLATNQAWSATTRPHELLGL